MKGTTRRYILNPYGFYSWYSHNLEETDEVSSIKLITEHAKEALKDAVNSSYPLEKSIIFSPKSENTIEIKIWDIFEAKITVEEKLYTLTLEFNDHYDGYSDPYEYVEVYTPTDKLKNIAQAFKDIYPNLSVYYY